MVQNPSSPSTLGLNVHHPVAMWTELGGPESSLQLLAVFNVQRELLKFREIMVGFHGHGGSPK